MRALFAVIFLVFIMMSCRSSSRQASDKCTKYLEWFNNTGNGMMKQSTVNNVTITCSLTNDLYETILLSDKSCKETRKHLNAQNKQAPQLLNFTLKVSNDTWQLTELRSLLDGYLKDEKKNNFKLIHGTDTLSPIFYHFENQTSIAPKINFIIGFEAPAKLNKDLTLYFTDQVLGINQSFSFNQQNINRIPKI